MSNLCKAFHKLFVYASLFLFFFLSQESFAKKNPDDTVTIRKQIRVMHIGWKDGRVPEFSSAYTLQQHEFRLNVLGQSAYAFSNRVEALSYLPLIMCPNLAIKYKFIDKKYFASAIETGAAGGVFPLAAATGLILPGAAIGAGTIGLLHGSDLYAKLYLSLHLSDRLTFSIRGAASTIHVGYFGLVAFAGLGGNGAAAGIIGVNPGRKFTWLMSGFETDFVLNQKNAIVLNTSLGGFEGGKKQLGMATLAWTHAKIHFHYTLGFYGFFDPPSFEIVNHSKLPVSFFANVYWIFNNGRAL